MITSSFVRHRKEKTKNDHQDLGNKYLLEFPSSSKRSLSLLANQQRNKLNKLDKWPTNHSLILCAILIIFVFLFKLVISK